MRYFLLFFLYILLAPGDSCRAQILDNSVRLENVKSVDIIAFGSCNETSESQSYWDVIAGQNPDLWIWMGDNIYADTDDMALMQSMYDAQKENQNYKSFRTLYPIIGIWDDHDYGQNDGNKTYPYKEQAKDHMLDFLDVPNNHLSRKRKGAYQSYTIGNDNRVKIILLDTRSFQDPLTPDPSKKQRYLSSEGDLLGEDQWTWLENELANSLAPVNIIVSSIQVLAKDHKYEKWANFPKSKNRLFQILKKHSEQRVIFLSGDRHIAEISKISEEGLDYPIYDITSSGLTHSYEAADEYNEFRVGDLVPNKNFGVLSLKWNNEDLSITVKIYSTDGKLLLNEKLGIF